MGQSSQGSQRKGTGLGDGCPFPIEPSLMGRNHYNKRCYDFLQSHQLLASRMEMPLHQQFEKQRLQGVVHRATDLAELKGLTQQLIDLYFKQKAATAWVIADKS